MAAPFDPNRLEVTGDSFPVVEGVMTNRSGSAQYSVSSHGRLFYIPGVAPEIERSLVWVDRQGNVQPVTELRKAYEDLDLSPDGRWVATTIEGQIWNIWLYDLVRGTLTRFTFEGDNRDPLWTSDGKRIVYNSFRQGKYGIYWKPLDGSAPEERLAASDFFPPATSWSPDGKLLAFQRGSLDTSNDAWILDLSKGRKLQPLMKTAFNESTPTFSPDGKWLAYSSNESGRQEVYVQAFPGPGQKWQISTDGGTRPLWSDEGKELFYRNGDKLMVASFESAPVFSPGTPRVRFEGNYWSAGRDYDVTPDGQRFIFIKEAGRQVAATQIQVVLNWTTELRRKK